MKKIFNIKKMNKKQQKILRKEKYEKFLKDFRLFMKKYPDFYLRDCHLEYIPEDHDLCCYEDKYMIQYAGKDLIK